MIGWRLPERRSGFVISGFLIMFIFFMTFPVAAGTDTPRQKELRYLLRHDCGSCHGMTLKGGLGPSLEAASLKEKTDGELMEIIMEGVHGQPMPPWRGLLTHEDARWLIGLLRAGGWQK